MGDAMDDVLNWCRCGERLVDKFFECPNQHAVCMRCFSRQSVSGIAKPGECAECFESLELKNPLFPFGSTKLWIFVDNSNVWLEAKKLKSQIFNFDASEDPRLRLDIGKLTDIIEAGGATTREFVAGSLYGSEPPKLDTVWNQMRSKRNWMWKVKTFERSRYTNREKMIDGSLISDVRDLVNNVNFPTGGVIAVVTGDRDMIPCITPMKERPQWKFEVWMWDHATANEIKQMAQAYPGVVSWIPLDEYLPQISFSSFKINPKRWSKFIKRRSVVVEGLPTFASAAGEKRWLDKLEARLHWPFEYFFLGTDVVLVFRTATDEQFDRLFAELTKLESRQLVRVLTYVEYYQRKRRVGAVDGEDGVDLSNKFELLHCSEFQRPHEEIFNEDEESIDEESIDEESIDEEFEKFTEEPELAVVSYGSEKPRPIYSKLCTYRSACRRGKNCEHSHTPDEMWYFANDRRYHRACNHGERCPLRAQCGFAHSARDSFCLKCHRRGHLQTSCPEESDVAPRKQSRSPLPPPATIGNEDGQPTCRWKYRCFAGVACPFPHTAAEKEFFLSGRKGSRLCIYGTNCPKRPRCGFAHCAKDMFCVKCGLAGHLQEECTIS